uniref:Uncharacterized protein n=1 Tax=Zea mays TaxID=4577 RepID=B6SH00_MAIZE|nr:hypothetical protein [Zea mays]
MDREQCFKVVAAAVKSVAENSVVDLRSPEVAVLVEMLPVSGVPLGSSVAGVSVLPAELISTKPRLCVRSCLMQKQEKRSEIRWRLVNQSICNGKLPMQFFTCLFVPEYHRLN